MKTPDYPTNDTEFEDVTVASITHEGEGGCSILREDGWSFFVPANSPMKPAPGMVARFYGAGKGSIVRGLFLNGVKVFYRTAAEDQIYQNVQAYGADAKEWLARWDAGQSVWSIGMGGIGPGYEQAIQITVAEILRHLIACQYPTGLWVDRNHWEPARIVLEAEVLHQRDIEALGLSNSQWSAARSLAFAIYSRGPIAVMTDPTLKDRHIQVSRVFPQLPKREEG